MPSLLKKRLWSKVSEEAQVKQVVGEPQVLRGARWREVQVIVGGVEGWPWWGRLAAVMSVVGRREMVMFGTEYASNATGFHCIPFLQILWNIPVLILEWTDSTGIIRHQNEKNGRATCQILSHWNPPE